MKSYHTKNIAPSWRPPGPVRLARTSTSISHLSSMDTTTNTTTLTRTPTQEARMSDEWAAAAPIPNYMDVDADHTLSLTRTKIIIPKLT